MAVSVAKLKFKTFPKTHAAILEQYAPISVAAKAAKMDQALLWQWVAAERIPALKIHGKKLVRLSDVLEAAKGRKTYNT